MHVVFAELVITGRERQGRGGAALPVKLLALLLPASPSNRPPHPAKPTAAEGPQSPKPSSHIAAPPFPVNCPVETPQALPSSNEPPLPRVATVTDNTNLNKLREEKTHTAESKSLNKHDGSRKTNKAEDNVQRKESWERSAFFPPTHRPQHIPLSDERDPARSGATEDEGHRPCEWDVLPLTSYTTTL
ncbi:hypothetical protein SKAU_G00099900 [Synaphobranchus kaupii]|uniref:Uncharacterized protein n=1 Tax=Synaphobranchus kaupii TaxID=118154 RepID=A0A9Q1J696_SYNKA|nr:hypothetical protein SKAU_G00099900 [Synaphobranchus kaupii]